MIALGYTMVYGIIKLINFAHGDIYMVGAYVGFFAITMGHLSIFPALVVSMVVTGLLGVVVERLAYKPLRHAPRISILITAIGVSFLLEYVSMYFVSPTPRTFPAVFEAAGLSIGGFVVNGQQLLIFAITFLLMVLLSYIVQRTKIGKAMRAVSFDTETAQLMGIDADRVISVTFGIGSALAAAIGVRELTSVTQQLNLHYAEAVVTFLLSGLIYLALALGATRLGALLERRAAGGREARA